MRIATLAEQRSIGLPDREDVIEALRRILESPDFLASSRNRKFLAHIIEETLAGRAGRLKGYNIALEVFGRDSNFDSQTDPLVRIEAGRLRRSLEHYYLTAGSADPVRISIPKGGYAPVFERVARNEHSAVRPPPALQEPVPGRGPEASRVGMKGWTLTAGAILLIILAAALLSFQVLRPAGTPPPELGQPLKIGPSLLVQRFVNLSGDPSEDYFALGLTEELTAAATRFKSMKVFAGRSSDANPGPPYSSVVDGTRIDYVLKGSVRKLNDWIRVTVRLVDATTGEQLWTETYDRGAGSGQLLDIQFDVASKIAEAIGHPYNVLFTHEAKRLATAGSKDFQVYDCTLKIYAYWEQLNAARHRALRDCHELAVIAAPAYTDAWINLAWLYIDEHRFDYNRSNSTRPPLDRAADAARTATGLEPDNARAHLVTAIVYWFKHDFRAFDQEADLALSLNENDTSVAAELGMRFSLRGDWERAQPLLERAVARAPFKPHLYRIAYSLHAYEAGDYPLAIKEAERTGLPTHPITRFLEVAAYGQMGRTGAAREMWGAIRQTIPRMTDAPRYWMLDRGLTVAYVDRLMEGLDKAGVLADE